MAEFRFKDARGLTHALEDELALREAIADGRIKRGTPFARADEGWTVASLHPAYQEAAAVVPATRKSLWQLKGPELLRDRRGQALLVVVSLVLSLSIQYGRVQPSTAPEDATYVQALRALSGGDTTALALIQDPPRTRALRPGWAVIRGSLDVAAHMKATQRRLQLAPLPPQTWLSDSHLARPWEHGEIVTYWRNFQRFHEIYRDSVLMIAERAIITHAAEADVKPKHLAPELEAVRAAMALNAEMHATAVEAAVVARRIHQSLFVVGPRPRPRGEVPATFPRDMAQIQDLSTRLDSLEALSRQRSSANIERLAALAR